MKRRRSILITELGKEAEDFLERADEIVAQSEESGEDPDPATKLMLEVAFAIDVEDDGRYVNLMRHLMHKYNPEGTAATEHYEIGRYGVPWEKIYHDEIPREAWVWIIEFSKVLHMRSFYEACARMCSDGGHELTVHEWFKAKARDHFERAAQEKAQ